MYFKFLKDVSYGRPIAIEYLELDFGFFPNFPAKNFFLRSGVGSLGLVVVFRLELFALSQPDISFSSVLDI